MTKVFTESVEKKYIIDRKGKKIRLKPDGSIDERAYKAGRTVGSKHKNWVYAPTRKLFANVYVKEEEYEDVVALTLKFTNLVKENPEKFKSILPSELSEYRSNNSIMVKSAINLLTKVLENPKFKL